MIPDEVKAKFSVQNAPGIAANEEYQRFLAWRREHGGQSAASSSPGRGGSSWE